MLFRSIILRNDELTEVMDAWPNLSEAIRAGILAMARSAATTTSRSMWADASRWTLLRRSKDARRNRGARYQSRRPHHCARALPGLIRYCPFSCHANFRPPTRPEISSRLSATITCGSGQFSLVVATKLKAGSLHSRSTRCEHSPLKLMTRFRGDTR